VISQDSIPHGSSKYNLRPCKGTPDFLGKIAGGLGFLDEKGQKLSQRGRKYYMSMVLKQTYIDIKCGKQLSLIGALQENAPF
jgi:hypothetical protein